MTTSLKSWATFGLAAASLVHPPTARAAVMAAGHRAPPAGSDSLHELLPASLDQIRPAAGSWAEYDLRTAKGELSARMRFAVLDEVTGAGSYRLELRALPRAGLPAVFELQIAKGADGHARIEGARMMAANQAAVALPIPANEPPETPETQLVSPRAAEPAPQPPKAKAPPSPRAKSLTTPAGTFTCQEELREGGSSCVSPAVPLWGLVRARARDGRTLLLRAFGDNGARSALSMARHGKGSESEK